MSKNVCRLCKEEKKNGKCGNCIIGGIALEIKKPLDGSWDALGFQLRTLRSITHRLLNVCMLQNSKAYMHSKHGGEKLKIYSYPAVKQECAEMVTWCRSEAEKKKAKAMIARDKEQRTRRADKKEEYGKEADKLEADYASLTRRADTIECMNSSLLAYLQHTADAKFRGWMKSGPNERLPMYKRDSPILVPGIGFRILGIDKSGVEMQLNLLARHPIRVAVSPTSGSAWKHIQDVQDGKAITGDMKIIYLQGRNRTRKAAEGLGSPNKGKWLIRLSIIKAKEKPKLDKNVTVAVNRGRNNFLYAVASNGRSYKVIMKGDDLKAFKRQMASRRRSLKSKRGHRGNGALGHGQTRYFKPETKLKDDEKNYVKTHTQQAASALNTFADIVGAGVIVREDFTKISTEDLRYMPSWPWYALAECIDRKCEVTGKDLVTVDSAYISSICPRCFNKDVKQVNPSTGIFHCKKCTFSRESDFVACYHLLERSGVDMTPWHKALSREFKLVEELRDE